MSQANVTIDRMEWSDPLAPVLRHRTLTWELAKREIRDRYAGQVFGAFWAAGHPIALMAVYVFMFAYVLKLKVGGDTAMPLDFTVYMLAGLVPWLAFQESMTKAASVVVANSNLVKQVVFPLEVLPIKGILAASITQAIATLLLVLYTLVTSGSLPWTYVLLPGLWAMQFLAVGGVCYLIASIAVYFRDVKDFLQLFCTAGVYFMPVCYLPEWVPELVRPVLWLNPFSYLVWCYQDVCYFGRIDHPWAWAVFAIGSVSVFYVGFNVWRKLKTCFGSVL